MQMAEKQSRALSLLEHKIGYHFENQELLKTALTCPSYRAEQATKSVSDNQRLEFLGDAVFGLLAAQFVYTRFPEDQEGALTMRRSYLASGHALAVLARQIELGDFLSIGKRDEARGGRDSDRALADALEALLGAAWCDGGIDAARLVFEKLIINLPEMPRDLWTNNPKGQLQELAQHHAWLASPVYELIEVTGPQHLPVYTVKARVATGHEALGKGATKQAAEVAAASALLTCLKAVAAEGGLIKSETLP